MKKLSILASIAALLSFAACNDRLETPVEAEEVSVTFAADLLGEAHTRAFNDGTKATTLSYAVFVNGQEKSVRSVNDVESTEGSWNITMELVRGVTYDIVFWADAKNSAYTFETETANVSADYSKASANDDSFDAFCFLLEDYKVDGPKSTTIALKRAVAQINVGTSDLIDAGELGLTGITSSSMTVKDVCTKYDLLNKKVVETAPSITFNANGLTELAIEEPEAADATAAAGDMPIDEISTFKVKTGENTETVYKYLTRNHIFAGAGNVNLSFSVKYNNGKEEMTHEVSNVPVKTNHRTNIYGQLFLNAQTLAVKVDAGTWDGNTDIEYVEVKSLADIPTVIKNNAGKNLNISYTGNETPTTQQTYDLGESYSGCEVAFDLPASTAGYVIKAADGDKAPSNIDVTIPAGNEKKVTVEAKNTTVTVNGNIESAEVATGNDTFVIGAGSTVEDLTVKKGNVKLEGNAKLNKITNSTKEEAGEETLIYIITSAEATLPKASNMTGSFEVVYSMEEKNLRAAIAGGLVEYTLKEDINTPKGFAIAADKTFVLNLDGHSITVSGEAAITNNGGTLTINGEGSVISEAGYAVAATSGTTNLNGGRYESAKGACVSVGEDATLAITAGIFTNFNPTSYVTSGSETMLIPGTTNYEVGKTYTYDEATKTYYILSANGLRWFAAEVNGGKTFSKETVKMTCDINLNSEEWTPIGNSTNKFQGTFDGQNYTIRNLKVIGNNSYVGLFGYTTSGEIKNLIVENAEVKGYLGVGVIVGCPYTSKYTNITVRGLVKVDGYSYVGGVGGRNAYASWTDITVDVKDGSYVNCDSENYRTYVGGVVGFMGEGNVTMKNITSNIDVIGSTIDAGGIVGIAHYGNKFINCSSSGNVSLTKAESADDAEEIGGIAGVWMNSASGNVTFTDCSFTGTLTTNITEGVDLSNNTITGAKYNKDSEAGKLIIDSTEYLPKDWH